MKVLAVILVWAGCLLAYLASERQQMTRWRLPRVPAWVGFAAALLVAALLFGSAYNAVSATLLVLTCVMCVWPALILAVPHCRHRPVLVNGLGMLALTLVAIAG